MPGFIRKLRLAICVRLVAYAIAFGLPILAKYLLLASLPISLLIILPGLGLTLVELGLAKRLGVAAKIARVLSNAFFVIFALALAATIVITPYAAYKYFFDAFSNFNFEELYVSNIFVLLVAFLSLVFAVAMIRSASFAPLLALASAIAGLALIVFRTPPVFLALIVLLALYGLARFRSGFAYVAVTFAACGALSFLCLMLDPDPGGSTVVEQVFYPGLRTGIIGLFPDFPLFMDIPGYGLAFGTTKLGGSALLTKMEVLDVASDTNETLYLKTNAYMVYTGRSWENAGEPVPDPVPVDGNSLAEEIAGNGVVEIKILSEAFFTVPYTLDTVGFEYSGNFYEVNGKRDWAGIVFKTPLSKNRSLRLFRSPKEGEDLADYGEYLRLPGNLPGKVGKLAGNLSSGADSDLEILLRIQRFLSANNEYDLDAPVLGDKDDFVAKFLFDDKRGYCTHFASAFVVLARLAGIPARYATGYLVYRSGDTRSRIVTARSAHAWPEVYAQDRGWSVWEATAAVDIRSYTLLPYRSPEYGYMYGYSPDPNGIAKNSLTRRQLEDLLGIKMAFSDGRNSGQPSNFRLGYGHIFLLVVPLVIGLVVFVSLFMRRMIRYRDPQNRAKHEIVRVVKMFKDAPPPEHGGWIEWRKNVLRIYGPEKEKADMLLSLILKIAYSARAASNSDIKQLVSLKKIFVKALLKKTFMIL